LNAVASVLPLTTDGGVMTVLVTVPAEADAGLAVDAHSAAISVTVRKIGRRVFIGPFM
jgi:hypothetical protein